MNLYKSNIDFNSYRIFYVVAKCQSFSKASKELFISQPAVSISIKKLEEQLNVTLFKRNQKGIELTEVGNQLLFYVESIVNILNTTEKRIKEDNNFSNGEIRIGVPTHIGVFLLSEIINKFKNLHPGVRFYIESRSTKDMMIMLEKREIDMIIDNAPLNGKIDDMQVLTLMKYDNCFAANKKYLKLSEKIVDFCELNKYQLLLPAERTSTRNSLENTMKKESSNLKLNPTIEVSTTELMYDLVKKGLGIGYFTKSSVIDDIVNHDLYEIKTRISLPKTEVCLAFIPDFLSNLCNKFIDFIIKEINKKKVCESKSLRLIYTQKCMYNCSFCHKEGLKRNVKENIGTSEILKFFKFLKNTYNINSIHFTGGEPFLNQDLQSLVIALKNAKANITITSNGYSINPSDLIFDSIDKLNFSIHSLDEKNYENITKVKNSYKISIDNVKKLRTNYPLLKLEVNTTLTKELIENIIELEDLIEFSKGIKSSLKIIELFPNTNKTDFVSIEEMKKILEKRKYKLVEKEFRRLVYENNDHRIILIKCTCSAASEYKNSGELCNINNDLFLSMDGNLNLCRFNDEVISIYEELKNEDYSSLKKKVDTYFEKLGNNCIYDKEVKENVQN